MGSGHINNENIYEPLAYLLVKTELEGYSKTMKELEASLKAAEELRLKYTSTFGEMIFLSGSIVLKEPNLRTSLKGLLYQIARDHGVILNLTFRSNLLFSALSAIVHMWS